MMTRRDPWVNLLRSTVAVFSAGLGGADSVCVLPFTQALGLPDAFARRIARNTQLVLLEESNLGKVADPAAGSGGVEALTDALVERGYALFQEIEKAGGLARALEGGAFQAEVAKTAAERAKNVARRKEPLTGASEFPDIHEKPVTVLAPAPAAPKANPKALAPHRVAEAFEALRDQAEARDRAPEGVPRQSRPGRRLHGARDVSPRTSSRRAGSRRSAMTASPTRPRLSPASRPAARSSPPCARLTPFMPNRGWTPSVRSPPPAPTSMSPDAPGEIEAQWREAGARDFIHVGSDVLAQLREALQAA